MTLRDVQLSRRGLLIGAASMLAPKFAFSSEPAVPGRTLICVFLRGAVDGLSVVVPYTEAAYYAERPSIAIARPKQRDGVLDLDGRFGLHPRLASLKPLFDAGELGLVHAVGAPRATRSHFEAQDDMETALPGAHRRDGWLARALASRPGSESALRALALSSRTPLALNGLPHVLSAPALDRVKLEAPQRQRDRLEAAFLSLYEASPAPDAAAREALQLAKRLRDLDVAGYRPENGASYDKSTSAFRDVALMMKAEPALEVAWIDLGGWDTHQAQGNATGGRLAPLLENLGNGLAALRRDLGARFEHTLVVVMTEFGRTLHENGTRGTDHGHGSMMFLAGGAVLGKRVYGDFPGLSKEQLFEGRDLAVTTDFRSIFLEITERHFALSNPEQALPDYAAGSAPRLGFLRP